MTAGSTRPQILLFSVIIFMQYSCFGIKLGRANEADRLVLLG
jgi:hypothetical protein